MINNYRIQSKIGFFRDQQSMRMFLKTVGSKDIRIEKGKIFGS
jgi:hypothetical protein